MNIILLSVYLATLAFNGSADKSSVIVSVTNLKVQKGIMEISLYNKPETYPIEGKEYRKIREAVTGPELKCVFKDLPPGEYAVALYHDENCDGKCNVNIIGYPKEGFGFSNNVKPFLTAPSFRNAKFNLPAGKIVALSIRLLQ